jgi:hypothetical protein
VVETLIAAREALAVVGRAPEPWDEAAVQLDQLRPQALRIGYPQYLYGLLAAARTARAAGIDQFTAIEFGVAGGNGLVAMEQHAASVEQLWSVSIHVVGFDTSSGLPRGTHPFDCPFAFRGGEFTMDAEKLRARLHRAELRLGDITETGRTFAAASFPPVGFVSNDLDLYTSTRDSFVLFDLPPERFLPRVTMYFDDLMGYPYTTITGEWAAIEESNSIRKNRQLGHIYGLEHHIGRTYRFAAWPRAFFVMHVFDHPAYNAPELARMPDLTLRGRHPSEP